MFNFRQLFVCFLLLFAFWLPVLADQSGIHSVSGYIHLVYDQKQVRSAIPEQGRTALIAISTQQKDPHMKEEIAAIQQRTVDRDEWQIPVEYWGHGSKFERYTVHGEVLSSRITDGAKWMIFVVDKYPTIGIYPSNRTLMANPKGTNVAGSITEEIPFLGFAQPGKVYETGNPTIIKTAQGDQLHCSVPHGYQEDSTTGDPIMLSAVLTFDKQNHLIQFDRDEKSPGIFRETYQYSNFVYIPGEGSFPSVIKYIDRNMDIPNEPAAIDRINTFILRSFDTKPIALDIFEMEQPEAGTYISDFRFHGPGMPERVFYKYNQSYSSVDSASATILAYAEWVHQRVSRTPATSPTVQVLRILGLLLAVTAIAFGVHQRSQAKE